VLFFKGFENVICFEFITFTCFAASRMRIVKASYLITSTVRNRALFTILGLRDNNLLWVIVISYMIRSFRKLKYRRNRFWICKSLFIGPETVNNAMNSHTQHCLLISMVDGSSSRQIRPVEVKRLS